MNKKTLLTVLLLMFFSYLVQAQTKQQESASISSPTRNEYLLKEPIWSVSFGSGLQAYFGEDDHKVDFAKRLTYAPTLSISRRFGNFITGRFYLTGGSLHGYNDGVSGFYTRWMTQKYYDPGKNTLDPAWEYMGWVKGIDYDLVPDGQGNKVWASLAGEDGLFYTQHMRYISASVDVMFNILNMLDGYQPNRLINVNPFVGVGAYQRFAHKGTLNNTFFGANLGLNISGRVSDRFSVFGEARGVIVSDEFDGQVGDMGSNGIASLTVGVSYHFGQPKYIDPAIELRLNTPYNLAKSKDGMVLVPGGNIELGLGVDPVWGDSIPTKLVAVSPFWMDETEVTNSQYREFVFWVRDSIIRERLADPTFGGNPSFKIIDKNGRQVLNWKKSIPWKNPTEREANAIISVIGGDPFGGDLADAKSSALNYKYEWFDAKSYYLFLAESRKNGDANTITVAKDTAYVNSNGDIIRETITRQSYGNLDDFTNTYIVNVYPDEFVWLTDFANAKNEQYFKNYYSSSAFDNFPVVGVSWEQADAYCKWRTDMFRAKGKNLDGFEYYRLPTEAEFEFAARSGRSELPYSWYTQDIHTSEGLAQANYRSSKDLKDLISPVATFLPNRFGLYDMAGNVAEWTITSYTESLDLLADDVNPDYSFRAVNSDPDILKRKVIKGGSWKDAGEFAKVGNRTFEQQNKGRSYLGFRCVRSWGVDKKGNFK